MDFFFALYIIPAAASNSSYPVQCSALTSTVLVAILNYFQTRAWRAHLHVLDKIMSKTLLKYNQPLTSTLITLPLVLVGLNTCP